MKIITGTKDDLFRVLERACKKVRYLERPEDRFEFYNYIGNLYGIINSMDDNKLTVDYDKIFGNQKEYDAFLDRVKILKGISEDNFLRYKDFHNYYMGNILDIANNGIANINVGKIDVYDVFFSADDFYCILSDFFKTVNMEKDFDSFIKNRKLFSRKINYATDDYAGCILIDPISCEMSVVAGNFKHDLETMYTCVHEFGHVFDLKHLKGKDSAPKITDYFYKSLYDESISRLFEKLFVSFMLDKKIMPDYVLEKQARAVLGNYDYVLAAYIFSLFGEDEIRDGAYSKLSSGYIVSLLGDKFLDKKILKLFLHSHELAFPDDLAYSYGDVMSTFLKDSVDKEGFESKLFRDFMDIRTEEFTPQFIESHDLTPKQYKKLYNKEIEQIKK